MDNFDVSNTPEGPSIQGSRVYHSCLWAIGAVHPGQDGSSSHGHHTKTK